MTDKGQVNTIRLLKNIWLKPAESKHKHTVQIRRDSPVQDVKCLHWSLLLLHHSDSCDRLTNTSCTLRQTARLPPSPLVPGRLRQSHTVLRLLKLIFLSRHGVRKGRRKGKGRRDQPKFYDGISLRLDVSVVALCLSGWADDLMQSSSDWGISGRLFLSRSWSVTLVCLLLSEKKRSFTWKPTFSVGILSFRFYVCAAVTVSCSKLLRTWFLQNNNVHEVHYIQAEVLWHLIYSTKYKLNIKTKMSTVPNTVTLSDYKELLLSCSNISCTPDAKCFEL